MEKKVYKLNINDKFKNLIPPLSDDEYKQLEVNILKYGCREPLCVWNNTIIDGHNRYAICSKNNIPFSIQEISDIEIDEDAIVWICSNQLGRRNISEIARKMLIGERYNAELIVNSKKNPQGLNQHSILPEKIKRTSTHATAEKIGKEYNISETTVRRYAQLSKVVNKISETNPDILKQVKSGNINLTRDVVCALSLEQKENNQSKSEKTARKRRTFQRIKKKFQIKEMPLYSPNAEFESLAHTIPSWQGSIDRVLLNKNIDTISEDVKKQLKQELEKIKFSIETMLYALEESSEGI